GSSRQGHLAVGPSRSSNYYYCMTTVDLTPFGFTATESAVYAALLRLGPATGYGVGRATRLARANAYAALEGLVTRGAAQRAAGRPARWGGRGARGHRERHGGGGHPDTARDR